MAKLVNKIILKSIDNKYVPSFKITGAEDINNLYGNTILEPRDLVGYKDGYINISCGVSGVNREIVIFLKNWNKISYEPKSFKIVFIENNFWILKPSKKETNVNLYLYAYENRRTSRTSRTYVVDYGFNPFMSYQYNNWYKADIILHKEEPTFECDYYRTTGRGNHYHFKCSKDKQ